MTTTITKTVTVIKRVVNVFTTTFSSLKSHPMLKTGGCLHFLWNRRLKMEFLLRKQGNKEILLQIATCSSL